MFNNYVKERFWENFKPKKLEKGWWELAGYWIVKFGKNDWVLCTMDEENPKFISPGRYLKKTAFPVIHYKKSDAYRAIENMYAHLWRSVEKIEEERATTKR